MLKYQPSNVKNKGTQNQLKTQETQVNNSMNLGVPSYDINPILHVAQTINNSGKGLGSSVQQAKQPASSSTTPKTRLGQEFMEFVKTDAFKKYFKVEWYHIEKHFESDSFAKMPGKSIFMSEEFGLSRNNTKKQNCINFTKKIKSLIINHLDTAQWSNDGLSKGSEEQTVNFTIDCGRKIGESSKAEARHKIRICLVKKRHGGHFELKTVYPKR